MQASLAFFFFLTRSHKNEWLRIIVSGGISSAWGLPHVEHWPQSPGTACIINGPYSRKNGVGKSPAQSRRRNFSSKTQTPREMPSLSVYKASMSQALCRELGRSGVCVCGAGLVVVVTQVWERKVIKGINHKATLFGVPDGNGRSHMLTLHMHIINK